MMLRAKRVTLKSPVREIRTPGFVRGRLGNWPFLPRLRKNMGVNGARLHKGALVIPMRKGGELHSLQFIGADGNKRFLSGGRVSGCYCSIGTTEDAKALCIVEGFATGATVHQATGYPVAVAFNAGNLKSVALAMRERFPTLVLIVCADDDAATERNPEITKARLAAIATERRTSQSFTVRGARLTIALQVHEAILRSLFDRSGGLARGTGFLARFLVAWPESTQGYRPFCDPPDTWPALARFNQRTPGSSNRMFPLMKMVH
jgi:hypothetical protein